VIGSLNLDPWMMDAMGRDVMDVLSSSA
jgi:hypothetical protein